MLQLIIQRCLASTHQISLADISAPLPPAFSFDFFPTFPAAHSYREQDHEVASASHANDLTRRLYSTAADFEYAIRKFESDTGQM